MPAIRDRRHTITLVLVDLVALSLAWFIYYTLRVTSGLFATMSVPEFVLPMLVIDAFWIGLFTLFGLYRPWEATSRIDEFIVLAKTITLGVLVLFFAIFIDDAITNDPAASRLKILLYWVILLVLTGSARMAVRSMRRRMLIAGIGLHTTVLVGPFERVRELAGLLKSAPALGYAPVGYLDTAADEGADEAVLPFLGPLSELEDVIETHGVREILVTIDSSEHAQLLDIIGRCSAYNVHIKIRPDLYDIVSGQARTNQLYGVPLIEVTPQLMAPWEETAKRAFDILISTIALIVSAPLFVVIAIAQKLSSPGPVFYRQDRVGKGGRTFPIAKFRTMYVDAESRTGPTWAEKDDPRVTPLGRFMRKTHLDELPQFFNVLEGHMSIVGPRPERPFFVEQFIREIPLYRRRLNVRPGITGWAQVKHTYDQSIEDVRTKLSYDLFYIENMSLRMDMKIMVSTLYTMVAGKGHA